MTSFFARISAVLLLLGMTSLQAGSYFSAKPNGLGMRNYNTGVRGLGMGYTGIASADSLQLNNFAPTQWRFINRTRATIGMTYQGIQGDLPGNSDVYNSTADFAGMNIAVPVVQSKWFFGMSVVPYTEMDFKAARTITSDGETFTQIDTYSGNVTRAQFNVIWAVRPNLGVAASFNYFFGTLKDQYDFRFNSANFRNTTHTITYRFTGPGFSVSADWAPGAKVRLAGFADFKPSIDLNVRYDSPLQLPDDQARNFDSFPMQFGVGSAFRLSERWQTALDYTRQNWGDALKTASPEFSDWQIIGIGFERSASRERSAGTFDRSDLRFGFSTRKLGYTFNNNDVSEYAVHLGIGFPFGAFDNRVDFSLVGGMRGDMDKNLAEERFMKFNVSISFGELWFQRAR